MAERAVQPVGSGRAGAWIVVLAMLMLPGLWTCCSVSGQTALVNDGAAPATNTSLSAIQIPLIFPGMFMQGTDSAQFQTPPGGHRLDLRAPSGERIEGLFCPASVEVGIDTAHRPTVLYFYGNGQCLATSLEQVALLRRCGADVLIADYLGYGLSEGKPSEAGCYAAATALYDYAMAQPNIDHSKLVAAGWSLGAAVAIDLAARKNMAGLITLSAFTSMRDMAHLQFPSISPLLVEHPFLSRDKIRAVTCRTLMIHGRRDTLVPLTMSGELRNVAAGKPLTYLPISGAGHNDLFLVGGKQIETTIRSFLRKLDSGPIPTSQPGASSLMD